MRSDARLLFTLTYRDRFKSNTGFVTGRDLAEAFLVGKAWCRKENKTFVGVQSAVLAGPEILEVQDGEQAPPAEKKL